MSRLGDRFVLVRELGSGGVARVYLGRDELLDRPVAVKVLEAEFDDPQIGPLFRREGRTAARLSHPNTVRVYDAGEDHIEGREVSYIVMEYVPGGDLKNLVDRTGPVPEAMLSRLGADVVAGLIHAHERGIRTFETSTRFTLDLSAVIVAKRLTDLPVIVDPSHAAGRRDLVVPLSKAAVAAEADGLMIESHHEPQEALCDGEQALPVEALMGLKDVLQPFASAMGREVI